MYNNPLDNKEFRFYLNFKNDSTGLIEISEPVKFDASSFVIEQDKKRYGRDVFFMNEEISLEFHADYFTPSQTQITLPNGELVNHLSHAFEFIKTYYREFGFESEVEFILERNNVQFITGVLDFKSAETDELTYFNTKVIQNTKQAQIERRKDVQVDLFSDEDLDGNPITPIQTTDIFLKAKPVVQKSNWVEKNATGISNSGSAFSAYTFVPVSNQIETYGIDNSYAPYDAFFHTVEPNDEAFADIGFANKHILAATQLSNIKIKIKNVSFSGFTNYGLCLGLVTVRNLDSTFNRSYTFYNSNSTSFSLDNANFEIDIPYISAGQFISINFNFGFSRSAFSNYTMFMNNYHCDGIDITATSTAVSSIIKGVRHIDLIKQVTKSINGMEVIAPKYDVGGAFYDNFVFNGKLIRRFDNEPFYAKFKDAVEQLNELNSDYQINQDNVYIGQYNDYYNNNEIGAYLQQPFSEYKSKYNDRYSINTMEYSYKSFEQDRDESNTIDAVHTNTQWLLPNKQVENNLKINVDYVRDPFEIESARRQGINTKETTSLSNDDKIYILDIIPLPPNSSNNFTIPMLYVINASNLTLTLSSSGELNFTLLGFRVNDTILVGSDVFPSYDYKILSITDNLLTLQFLSFFPVINSNGISSLTFNYVLTTVGYTNRTSEEFQTIDNVLNPNDYSNLQYTIKRNLKHYETYLACASKYKQNGIIKNTYFKSNGELITEFRNGGLIKENDSINISDLETRLIEPIVITTNVICEYDDILETLVKMQTVNADESIGGFIRVTDSNNKVTMLYPTKLDYNWGTKLLEITGEQKYESDILEITTENGLIYINKVGYDEQIVKPLEVKTSGDYIQLFDFRGIALINEIKFTNVFVNSINFSNIVELTDVLINLW